MRPLLALTLLCATLVGAALAAPAAAQEVVRSITINSTGEVSIEPDMATVIIAVQADAEIAADALDQASSATSMILATLDVEGVAPDDIRSGAIRLSPRYSSSVLSSGNQIVGYQAVNSVEVQVNDLAKLGGLLAAVVGDGANRLDGVQFGLQDPSEAMDEARRRAVAEGVRLATLYADAASVPLGGLISLSEARSGGYRPVMAEARELEMAASSPQYDVPTAPGKIELRTSVNMVFEIVTLGDPL